MNEKRGSPERLRFYLRALIGFMVLLGAAGLVYLYLAFAPTGYEDLEERNTETVAKAEALARTRMATAPARGEGAKDDENTAEPLPQRLDLGFMFGADPDLGRLGWCPGERAMLYPTHHFQADGSTASLLELPPKLLDEQMRSIRRSLSQAGQPPTSIPDDEPRRRFRELKPAIGRGALSEPLILQAVVAGERERACDLLETYLDLIRTAHLENFPWGQPMLLRRAEQLLILLSQLDALPEEGFRRAGRVFESASLDEDATRAMYIALVMRSRDQLTQLLEEDKLKKNPNTWHYLFGGVLEAAAHRSLKPVINRQIDALAVAILEGSEDEALRAHERMKRVGRMLNLMEHSTGPARTGWIAETGPTPLLTGPTPLLSEEPTAEYLGFWKGTRFNGEAAFVRFILAAARYRSVEGAFPERVEDLVPEYLPESYLPSSVIAWGIHRLEPFVFCPLPRRGQPEWKTDPFLRAVERRETQEGQPPAAPEELRPYASSDAEFAAFQERFIQCEGRPVFFRLSKEDASSLGWKSDQPMIWVQARWPSVVLTFSAEGLPADGGRRLPPESGK